MREKLPVYVKQGTLIKWLADTNLVLVVLWSMADKLPYCILPSEFFSIYDLNINARTKSVLWFDRTKVMNQNAIQKVVWISRMRNLNRYFLETRNLRDTLTSENFENPQEYKEHQASLGKLLTAILIQFLKYIDILHVAGPKYRVNTRAFIEEMMYFGQKLFQITGNTNFVDELDFGVDELTALVVMQRAARSIPGIWLPPALLDDAYRFYLGHIDELIKGLSAAGRAQSTDVRSVAKKLWKVGAELPPGAITLDVSE
jgi:hypothetical protein